MLGILKNLFTAGDETKLKVIMDEGAVLLDVRTVGEFASGHIEGAVNIPLDRLGNQLQILRKDKPVVVYCRSGNRSRAAKEILEKKGFSNITDGGGMNDVNRLINNK